jgi:hypothetical protein
MSICTLYRNFKCFRKTRKENDSKVYCTFIPLIGDPWSEMLRPDKNGRATNKKGWEIILLTEGGHIYAESLPKKLITDSRPGGEYYSISRFGMRALANGLPRDESDYALLQIILGLGMFPADEICRQLIATKIPLQSWINLRNKGYAQHCDKVGV